MKNKVTILYVVLVINVSLSQPMDWCRYFSDDVHISNSMGSIDVDKNGGVWASTDSSSHGCIVHISREDIDDCKVKCKTIKTFKRNPANDIVASKLYERVWYFRSDSVYAFNINTFNIEYVSDYNGLVTYVTSGIELRDGRLVVGDRKGHLVIYDQDTWTKQPGPSDSVDLYPDLEDEDGNIWCYTGVNGIYKFDGTTWTSYNSRNSNLGSDRFYNTGSKIFEQQNGNIIVGTYGDGLYQFDGNSWQPYARPLPNENSKINLALIQDSSLAFWVDARPGVMRYDGASWYTYTIEDNKKYYSPFGMGFSDLAVDSENRVWITTHYDGIFMVNQNPVTSCMHSRRIVINRPDSFSVWLTNTRNNIEFDTYGYVHSLWIEYQVDDGDWEQIYRADDEHHHNLPSFIWTTPSTPSARYRIRITDLSDTTIRAVSDYFTIIDGDENLPPTLQNIPDSLEAKSEETTSWTAQATDPEGDPVTFTFTDLPSWATVSQSTLTLEPTRSDSSTTVQVIAADTNGGADTADIYIAVIHSTTAEWGIGAAGTSANMLNVGKMKINLPAGKIKRLTLFNMQGKMIATADTKNEYANLFRITRNITDSFVVAKIEYADKTSIQRTICLME